ncbi:S66 family peptidase [Paenibacillus guangzhouensis]|uniref:S66 family peptidase n=1 Tax=Paenibacillus guangzhouensis TaxID=1473112 RepID=UPI001266DF56|nr:S66 peptidase family protein [Paenibacillus guangzhouensis]
MRARKLQPGDEIRIISPSRSMAMIAEDQRELAKRRIEALGFTVTFGQHYLEVDDFISSPIAARVHDLHQAFLDPNVAGILTTIGGYNSNQLLSEIDFSIVQANPKRLCGYSDITALGNAIYARTGLITYSGPHFSTFGMLHGLTYTIDHFRNMMMEDEAITVLPSDTWSDDPWYLDQESREFIPNGGSYVIQAGEAEGIIIGGNLCTLNLLQGTDFMPSLANAILFIEDDLESSPQTFDRDLQSLIHQPGFDGVQAIVIGRFQKASGMTQDLLRQIITSKKALAHLPVIADVNFGHTTPQLTFPIGGRARVIAGEEIELIISE